MGSQDQRSRLYQQGSSSQSWYPPSVVSSPSSSRPTTPNSTTSSGYSFQRPNERSQSPSHVSPTEAAGIIAVLKEKKLTPLVRDLAEGKCLKARMGVLKLCYNVDELRKLLSHKDAYNQFLFSLDQVKIQNNLRDELHKETLQLARENLEKEPRIMELRNQCRIIRTTELAAAQERLNDLERRKEEILKSFSPTSIVHRLQESMSKTEEESENLHAQLLAREIDFGAFVQKYKKLRTTYHKRGLLHLAAKTNSIG